MNATCISASTIQYIYIKILKAVKDSFGIK